MAARRSSPEAYGFGTIGELVVDVVAGGMVATVDDVGGTKVADVGGVVVVVVVSGSSVVGGAEVVATGGDAGGTVTGGRVVAVAGWVVAPPPEGIVTGVVVVESTLLDVVVDDEDELDDVVARAVVEGRTVVTGAPVATCCFGEVSLPVTISKSRATRATLARA